LTVLGHQTFPAMADYTKLLCYKLQTIFSSWCYDVTAWQPQLRLLLKNCISALRAFVCVFLEWEFLSTLTS